MLKRYEDHEMFQGKTSPAKLRLQNMNASFQIKEENRLAKKKSKKKKYKEMYQLSFSAHLLTKTAQ